MEKQISILGQEYKLRSSLFSIISYRSTFGSELFNDISTIEKVGADNPDISKVIDVIFRVFYILHKPFTNLSYDDFLNNFGFDVLTKEEELTKLSEVIAELFDASKNGVGRGIETR